jgi:tetratricopeptide (TPR) repeat protein
LSILHSKFSSLANSIILVSAFILKAVDIHAAESDTINKRTVDLLMNQDYHSAHQYLDSILKNDPLNIDALYMNVALQQSIIADYESYILDGQRCIQSAQNVLSIIDNKAGSRSDTMCLFYKGNIYGIMSLIKAKNGDFIPSVKYARMSYEFLEKLSDNGHYIPDALYGTGLFDYYIGDNLKWVPGLGKKADLGLQKLYKAMASSSPFSYSAKISLLWILIEGQEYRKADSISSLVLHDFSENTVLIQIKSRAAFGLGNYREAISLSKKLIGISEKRDVINWTDILSGYQLIAASSIKLQKNEDAIKAANKALSYKIPADTMKIDWVQKHREYLLNIKKSYQK